MKSKNLLLLVVLSLSIVGCTRIGPGNVGIVVSMAGDNRGVNEIPSTTGWVFYNPLATNVFEYPTFVQTAVWTHNTAEGKPVNEEITFTTGDQMQVSADISIAYHLQADKVPHFYVKFRNDDLEKFTHGFLRNLAREKFDNIAGKYKIEQIMGDNANFLAETRRNLQEDLKPIGVELDQFGLISAPRPPQGVIDSINAKVQASQIAQQKQNELIQVQADAAKSIARADGDARSLLIRVEADAKANRMLAESMTPILVQLKSIEKWDGALPQVNGGSTPFVNLPSSGN